MNILITGITGYFGSHLAREFSQLGKIYGLKRASSNLGLLEDVDFPIVWQEGDISDMDSLLDAMKGMDLVIHSAGMVSFSSKDEEELYRINAQGTANVVNAMLCSGVKRLVHVSSVSAIGRSPEFKEYDENFKWVDSPLNSGYAVSKYWGELEVWRGEQEGLETLVVNPSILLGKASYEKSSGFIYQYVIKENMFFPKGNLNFIDIRDAASITRLLVEKNAWGERFILNKESYPYQHFFALVAKTFGVKAPKFPISNRMLRISLPILGFFKMLGLSKSPLNRQLANNAQVKIYYSNSKVQSLLDFKYRSLEETLDWAKQP
ncbi:NAD-dependent epimerase/dehydratase family protein [Algoriphagus sp. AK58]|uniref:NAD-dependent epimerase/dehydratase family protein n=1 Tax=Algoriphagus sp. AK58 TaxID=1406877 RepID=UPI0016505E76|nr:NAD-dependent epimerase/dehydratase family protein [Algoriphagus sp. AK58]MBC6365473.1 dihydroflavonol 4-reductase [Algoriphagus sp. AK58]